MDSYSPPMAERIKNKRLRANRFLDCHPNACAETVTIIANHWKRRYTGNPEVYDRICKAEAEILEKRRMAKEAYQRKWDALDPAFVAQVMQQLGGV